MGVWWSVSVFFRNLNTDIALLVPAGPVEHVHLRVPFVAIRNKEVNISAVVWPSQLGTLTYFWWFGNSTKVQPFLLAVWVDLYWTLLGFSFCIDVGDTGDVGKRMHLMKRWIHIIEYHIPPYINFIIIIGKVQIILRKRGLWETIQIWSFLPL